MQTVSSKIFTFFLADIPFWIPMMTMSNLACIPRCYKPRSFF